MAFQAAREYNLTTFDEATSSKDWEDDFTTTGARSSPFQDEIPLWRNSTLADAGYGTADSASGNLLAAKGLQDTLCRVERGLASVEKRMKYWDSCLYETIDDIKAKLKKLELSQAKRGDKLSNMRQRLRDKQVGLRDHNASFVSSPPKAAFRRKQNQVLICQLFCSLKDPMVASQVWEIVRTSCAILWNKSTNLLRTANRRKAVLSHKNPTSNLPHTMAPVPGRTTAPSSTLSQN